MKAIIAGGRDFEDYDGLCEFIADINLPIAEVVCGGAPGADALGKYWADQNNIPTKFFIADWNLYGNAAGPMRNRKMADYGDALIVFWDGESRGTKNMIEEAERKNLSIHLYHY